MARWVSRPIKTKSNIVYYDRASGKLVKDVRQIDGENNLIHAINAINPVAPLKLYFDFTKVCNLSCSHCITSSSPYVSSNNDVSTQRILQLIEEFSEIGILEVAVGGGEPFARKDIMEIFRKITDSSINLIITTNGTLINEGLANEISKIKPLEVRISFDGDDIYHDKIRGPGAFNRAISGVRALIECGIIPVVRYTISRENANALGRVIPYFASIGISVIKVALLKKAGRAAENDSFDFSYLDSSETENVIKIANTHGITIQFSSDDFTMEVSNDPKIRYDETNNCGAGYETAYISPDGIVLGCVTMPTFPFGNLKNNSFMDVWLGVEASSYRDIVSGTKARRICDAINCNKCESE